MTLDFDLGMLIRGLPIRDLAFAPDFVSRVESLDQLFGSSYTNNYIVSCMLVPH